MNKRPVIERFLEKITGEPNTGCWLWMAMVDWYGYACIRDSDGAMRHASRVSYEQFVGPIPAGLYVLHKCDTPSCVNPQHLFPGTQADNVADRDKKGRRIAPRGEANGKSKLSAEQVLAIRADVGPHREIAARYGVCRSTVSTIRRKEVWAHI